MFNFLAIVTIARLDQSERVRKLASDIFEINQEIEDELEWLSNIEGSFSEAAQIASGLNEFSEKLKKFQGP